MYLAKLLSKKLSSEFIRNSFVLISATTITQIISLLGSFIVLRIYTPADYGVLGLYMTISGLVTVIATLQYHNAIVTCEKDEEANQLLCMVTAFSFITAALTFIGVIFFKGLFYKIVGTDTVGNWLYFAPLSVFFGGANAGCSSMAIRKKFFKTLSVNRIVSALIVPVLSIVLGITVGGVLGLMVGLLASQIVPTILLFIQLAKSGDFKWDLPKNIFIALIKKHKNFPIYNLPSDFLNNLSNQIPIFMLAGIAGIQVIGWYNLCCRLLILPSQVISNSISEVFRQRATEDYYSVGTCRPIYLKVFKTLLLLSLVPFAVLMLFGPHLFSFFFGEKWREAGALAQILGVLFVFKFVVSPITYVINVANKQYISLITDVLMLATMGSMYGIVKYYHLNYQASLFIYSISYSILYILTFFLCLNVTENKQFNK